MYEILTLEPMPTGVEHMGAVEMGLEPTEQWFVETHEAATARAERIVRAWRDGIGTREAWDDAYPLIYAAANLPEDGGRVGPFGDAGTEILVRRSRAFRETNAPKEPS